MSNNLRIPYIVKPGTAAMKAVDAWQECVAEFSKAGREFAEKHGAKHFWEDGYRVTGLYFPEPHSVPAHWRVRKKDQPGEYTPYGGSEAAQKARKEIAALPRKWDSMVFANRFGGVGEQGNTLIFPGLHYFGDKVVMTLPARIPMPDIVQGCEEMYLSDFYKLLAEHTKGGQA